MSRRRIALIVLCAFGGVVLVGTVLSLLLGASNCTFDPPPGDVTTMTLINDTSATVEFVECDNDMCTHRSRVDGGDVVTAHSTDRYWNHEDCGREPVGILDRSGALLGCIVLPVADPPKVTTWRVSQRVKCSGPIG